MKKALIKLYAKFRNWIIEPILLEDGFSLSWADKITIDKPTIVLYTRVGCTLCEELELFFENNWIPYERLNCDFNYPFQVPKQKHLLECRGFNCTSKSKGKKDIVLFPIFPQIEFIEKDGTWRKEFGNPQVLRTKVEEFIDKNIKYYPGFEAGIYGDKLPAEQAASQIKNQLENSAEAKLQSQQIDQTQEGFSNARQKSNSQQVGSQLEDQRSISRKIITPVPQARKESDENRNSSGSCDVGGESNKGKSVRSTRVIQYT